MCLERSFDPAFDFAGVAAAFAARADAEDGVLVLDEALLRSTPGLDGRAVGVLLDDLALLEDAGRDPQLNVITRYPRDLRGLAISTDVHSFHVDRAPIEADTFLCTYAGASSEVLDNDDATRLLDDPALAASVRGLADEGFALQFGPKAGALPHALGTGHLWRLAVDWPGAPGPACIHRAPLPDGRARLLLIA